jgi:dCTP deaminase
MVLSDMDIRNGIESGQFGIEPFDPARLNPASYTLSLGGRLLVPRPSDVIDPDAPHIEYDEVEIGENGYVVKPGDFLLGSVAEKLTVPTTHSARLDARTSLARLGLNVLQGSTHIEPGQHDSNETLEISNIGASPVRLRVSMKIVKVVFEQLQTPATSGYAGSHAGQGDGRVR